MAVSRQAVAVIGAGVSGLACARALVDGGSKVTVFDKGRRVGGRMNRRSHGGYEFDHGAQYLTARDPSFRRLVEGWVAEGVLASWSFRVRDRAGQIATENRVVGAKSMRRLAEHLATDLEVKLGTRVAPFDGNRLVDDHGQPLGDFDQVVVTAPLEQARALVEFSPRLLEALGSANHDPCWCVMAGWSAPLSADVDAMRDVGPFAWTARNGSKPGRPDGEAWVLHATPEWSRAHLADDRDSVSDLLLRAFGEIVGPIPRPDVITAHRWRYARTRMPVGEPFLIDRDRRLVVAGDGLLGPRIEAAWLSGVAAAEAMLSA